MPLDGIRIRPAEPADADAIARVQSATWQAAYLGMLPHEILAAFGQAQGGAFWERVLTKAPVESVLVALLGDQVLGFISAGPIRERIPGYMVSSMRSTCCPRPRVVASARRWPPTPPAA